MSLLGTQVYANPATPCWASSSGGTITGTLVVDPGDIRARGEIGTDSAFTLYDPTGVTQRGQLSTDGGGTMYVRAPTYITFAQTGSPAPLAGNTSLTLSAAGSGLDLLSVGGRITTAAGGGITPFASIPDGSPSVVTLSTGTTSRVGVFGVTNLLNSVAGGEYDVQLKGFALWDGTGSAPASSDIVTISTSVGGLGTNNVQSQVFYPGATPGAWTSNVGNPFAIRARLKVNSGSGPISCQANFNGAAATGNIVATATLFDIVRVA